MKAKIKAEAKNIVDQLGLEKNAEIALEFLLQRSMGNIFKQDSKSKNSEILFGSEPVYDKHSEEKLIGLTIAFPEETDVKTSLIKPDYFFDETHKIIWEAICFIKSEEMVPTVSMIKSCIERAGHGEQIPGAYIETLPFGYEDENPEIITQYVRKVAGCYQMRSILAVLQDFIPKTYSSNPLEAIGVKNEAILSLEKIIDINQGNSFKSGEDLANEERERLAEQRRRNESGEEMLGHPTGLRELDKLLLGLRGPDLTILAGRPAMGKSALVICIAWFLVKHGIPVGFFSLEMSSQQINPRFWAVENERNSTDYALAKISIEEQEEFLELLSRLPLFLETKGGLTIDEFRAKAVHLVKEKGVKLLIVDYLQLMNGVTGKRYGNREIEVADISRGLKKVAMELNVPIIALAQLSRAVETRGGSKRPQLSDLRESGAIEQDADNVWFVYRPEYYQILEDENGESLRGVGEIMVAKHRNGALANVKCGYKAMCTKWGNYDGFNWDNYHNESTDNFIKSYKEDSQRKTIDDIFSDY